MPEAVTAAAAPRPWYKVRMPSFRVETEQRTYNAIVERGIIGRAAEFVPERSGKLFVVSTEDVWQYQGAALSAGFGDVPHEVLYLPGGEENKRLAPLEWLAERMVLAGADRSSVVMAFGGGIVTDMAGFLAAIFMRGIPVIQIPTTLLAQVDAGVGGKTGVNLESGKNLIGSFHQPIAANTARDCGRSSRPASSARPICFTSSSIKAPPCWRGSRTRWTASSPIRCA